MKTKLFPFFICLLLLNILVPFKLIAQTRTVDSLLLKVLETDEILPYLIDSAIKYSPTVNVIAGNVEYSKDNLKINKNNIFNGISLLSSYYYGSNISANNQSFTTGNSNTFTSGQSVYYNVGVGMQLPIIQILNRKTTNHAGTTLIKIAISQKEAAELTVKQQVITIYQDFKLSKKLLGFSGKIKDFATINYNMAEKDFIQGQGTVEQISRIQEMYSKAVSEYETYINKFQTSLMQLEALTHTDILSLIKKTK